MINPTIPQLSTKIRLLSFFLLLAYGVVGCGKTDHSSIEEWARTKKGPGKLKDALVNDELSADLRAHAAEVLLRSSSFPEIKEILETMDGKTREEIVANLSVRLWESARINDAMERPNPRQNNSKDALFYLLDLGNAEAKTKISEYLLEWFLGGHYEGRATEGKVSGVMVMRKLGKVASKRILIGAKVNVAKMRSEKKPLFYDGDEWLKALALSDSDESMLFLMNLIDNPRGDDSIGRRVMDALHFAFLEPVDIEKAQGKRLMVIKKELEKLFYDVSASSTIRNDAVALLAAIGSPECIPAFTRMIQYPTDKKNYRWIGAQQGARCGDVQGILAITEALPATITYERGMLEKYLWDEFIKFEDKKKIADAALALLKSESWVSRITGIELLGMLAKSIQPAEYIKEIESLGRDPYILRNWWGKQKKIPKSERKGDPTLGELARNVAKSLGALAKEGANK